MDMVMVDIVRLLKRIGEEMTVGASGAFLSLTQSSSLRTGSRKLALG